MHVSYLQQLVLFFSGNPENVRCAEDLATAAGEGGSECNNIIICARETSLSLEDNSILPGLGEVPSTQIVSIASDEDILDALSNGTCDAVADCAPALDEKRAREAGFTDEYILGSVLVSKEPLAIETFDGNPVFSTFLNWVLLALFAAARHGITQSNALEFPKTTYLSSGNEEAFRNAVEAVGNMDDIIRRDKTILEAGLPPVDIDISGALTAYPLGLDGFEGLDVTTKTKSISDIVDRGHLRCAVRLKRPGFAVRSGDKSTTDYSGLDIDFCRALAAGVFEDEEVPPVEFVEVATLAEGYSLLSLFKVDVMAGAIWTLENDINEPKTTGSFIFSQPYFYRNSDDESAT